MNDLITRTLPKSGGYPNTVDTRRLDTGVGEDLVVTRFIYATGDHLVCIDRADERGVRPIVLIRDQAAELVEVLTNVSAMASAPSTAIFLADTVRKQLDHKGISATKAARLAGITRYRMRRLLDADVPMTLEELKAISAVQP